MVHGWVVAGPTGQVTATSAPQDSCPKELPELPLFFGSYPGKLGHDARPPSSPPPAGRKPAVLPRVRGAGSIRDVLMMNASSRNCGSVSQA